MLVHIYSYIYIPPRPLALSNRSGEMMIAVKVKGVTNKGIARKCMCFIPPLSK